MFLAIATLSQSVEAISIKDHEEADLSSECVIDPTNPNKMVCNEYCEVFNAASGNRLGNKNKYWNCNSQSGIALNSWKSSWNTNNPDKQLENCSPDGGNFHKAHCIVTSDSLYASSTKGARVEIIEQAGRNCSNTSTGLTCNFTGYYAKIYTDKNDFYIDFDDYDYLYDEISAFTRTIGPFPWVQSETGADISGNYTITPYSQYMVHENGWQHTFTDSCSPVSCNHDFVITVGFKACNNNDSTDCATHTFNLDIEIGLFD
jgi:hypothetical protein